jgi:ubiquinone/menaquinone biosynthesis C-methylase UbiE
MSERSRPTNSIPPEILAHYAASQEAQRLFQGAGQLERARTQELLLRYLPPPPAVIYDVGGGSGVYALWLARQDYEVHLLDAVPLHVEQAGLASAQQPDYPLASLTVGDARRLGRPDGSVEAVLMLGPLYHLTDRGDRLAALREARRVLRAGGRLLAAGISRFASIFDGLFSGNLDDPAFARIVQRDLQEGQHRNPEDHPAYFTTAFLHHPQALAAEIRAAGLSHETTLAVEGPGWLLPDFEDRWGDPERRSRLLAAVRALEAEPTLLGASAHLLAVAHKSRD